MADGTDAPGREGGRPPDPERSATDPGPLSSCDYCTVPYRTVQHCTLHRQRFQLFFCSPPLLFTPLLSRRPRSPPTLDDVHLLNTPLVAVVDPVWTSSADLSLHLRHLTLPFCRSLRPIPPPQRDNNTDANMSDEKVRVSGEVSRGAASPVLPTVNPEAEKAQAPTSSGIHPAFYVASVLLPLAARRAPREKPLTRALQSLDWSILQCHPLQQVDPFHLGLSYVEGMASSGSPEADRPQTILFSSHHGT